MGYLNAAQEKLLKNAALVAATKLLFSELEKFYPTKQLIEVVTIFNGDALKKAERTEDGAFDVYGSGGLVGKYSLSLSPNPFVVIGRKGSAGKPTYAPNGGWVIDTAYYAQPNNINTLDTKYLYYAISSLDFSKDIISTAIPGINRTAIYKHSIPIPPPEIQKKCAEFLDSTEAKTELPELPPSLDNLRYIVARIEALAARVQEALSLRERAVEETNNIAFAEARKIISTLNYPLIDLGELVDDQRNGIQTGPFGAQLGSGDFLDNGVPLITIGNVQYSGLILEGLRFISDEKAEQLNRYEVQEGDILFARMGTVGRCCVVPKSAEGWIYNYHLIRVALNRSRVEPRFIHWLIRASPDIASALDDKIRGATRQGVNSKIVSSLPCRVPSIDEQRRIVAHLDTIQAKVDELRRLQAETQAELSALIPSILDRAFKGALV